MPEDSTNTLTIQHQKLNDENRFHIVRPDGKHAEPVAIVSPFDHPVEGRPDSHLMAEIRWYLEDFLDYPFPPATERAARVQDALKAWGTDAFNALLDNRDAVRLYDRAVAAGHDKLTLKIASDDPAVLAWPWEALRDPEAANLAQASRIERRLNGVYDPIPFSEDLPRDRVNILLVIARPKRNDVHYRSIARPLVELIEEHGLPAEVHVLRPPTLGQLREHLEEHPNHYHILHFDGHGGYGRHATGPGDTARYGGPQGCLLFEDEDEKEHLVSADQLSDLLRDYAIPAVVLNACQSAMLDEEAEDPFAAVAAGLIRAGVRSVVAMAYSVYVSAAQEFLPAFYRALFRTGDMAEAVRAGRRQLRAQPERVCARGRFPLEDWTVPVLYQQEPLDFSFAEQAAPREKKQRIPLPREARDEENIYGFIGRDNAVLDLERAMRRKTPAILVHGLGGIGKTTLARGFVKWLADTDGLGLGCMWITFNDVHTSDFVINRMGEAFFGTNFALAPMEQRIEDLARALSNSRLLVVWDNFDTVGGHAPSGVEPAMPDEDRQHLLALLRKLRGGATKVLITSRSREDWLGEARRKFAIGGLQGEERWEFCEIILDELGTLIERDDPGLCELMGLLDGHPLLMRAVLPSLDDANPEDVIEALRGDLDALGTGENEALAKTYATLNLVRDGLPENLRPLLIPLAMHGSFVDADHVENMAGQVEDAPTRPDIDVFCSALARAGLLDPIGQNMFRLHPALTGFLRKNVLEATPPGSSDPWARAFVDVMGTLADHFAAKGLHEQRGVFRVHGANFRYALAEAARLDMAAHLAALTQVLAVFALHTRDFKSAQRLFQALADRCKSKDNPEGEAGAYHQLGRVAHERHDYKKAKKWYNRSLHITEKLGIEYRAAQTYHQLGMIAQHQHEYENAKEWCNKALAVFERLGIERRAEGTYHQLGLIAQHQHEFENAKRWYNKSLHITEDVGDELGAAQTYHQLGIVAQEQHEYENAKKWCNKSLHITEKLGDELGAAHTYHQLGMIAQHQHQHDHENAEEWYNRSLRITEKLRDEHGAACTYCQLGILAGRCEDFEACAHWLIKAAKGFIQTNDPHGVQNTASNFLVGCTRAREDLRGKLRAMWVDAGLGELPEEPDQT